jgi:hypothetical protein
MTSTKPSPLAEGNQHQRAGDHEGTGHAEDSSTKVEIPRDRYWRLVFDSECLQALLRSAHIADLLGEWHQWWTRRRTCESSLEMSQAITWRCGPTYKQLEERRRLTSVHPCHICGVDVEIVHPMPKAWFDALPRLDFVRCPSHAEAA